MHVAHDGSCCACHEQQFSRAAVVVVLWCAFVQGTASQWDWRRVQQQLLALHLSSPGLQLRLLSKLEEVAAHLINTARVRSSSSSYPSSLSLLLSQLLHQCTSLNLLCSYDTIQHGCILQTVSLSSLSASQQSFSHQLRLICRCPLLLHCCCAAGVRPAAVLVREPVSSPCLTNSG
jgi:hypothetical protein